MKLMRCFSGSLELDESRQGKPNQVVKEQRSETDMYSSTRISDPSDLHDRNFKIRKVMYLEPNSGATTIRYDRAINGVKRLEKEEQCDC